MERVSLIIGITWFYSTFILFILSFIANKIAVPASEGLGIMIEDKNKVISQSAAGWAIIRCLKVSFSACLSDLQIILKLELGISGIGTWSRVHGGRHSLILARGNEASSALGIWILWQWELTLSCRCCKQSYNYEQKQLFPQHIFIREVLNYSL